MKLFERHGGYWLFWWSAVYLTVGLYCALYYKDIPAAAVQLPWLFVIAGPLLIPPLGRWLNMSVDWDRKMFDWFKKKQSNVVPFPTEKRTEQPPAPPPEPEKEKPTTVYYRIGMASDNRVSVQVGYGEITMNAQGVQNMIDQLELFKSQIQNNESRGDV